MSRHLLSAEIFASSQDLDKVIVRLGGFHLLMSYLGSIGHIMSGSGLAELWETPIIQSFMLSGHAYIRSIRAHILSFAKLPSSMS